MIQTKHVKDDVTREERINMLEHFFLFALSEDGMHGTKFDVDVLDAMKVLREKYQNFNKERVIDICWCGGNIIKENNCRWCDKCRKYFCGCANL